MSDEQAFVLDVFCGLTAGPDRVSDLLRHEVRVLDRREGYPEHAVGEPVDHLGGRLDCQPGLAGAAGAGQGEHPSVGEQLRDLADLASSPDQRAGLPGQVGCVERAQGREVALTELEEVLGRDQVLEPVLAEIGDVRIVGQQRAGPLRDHHLPSVRDAGDPRGAVHVDPDVPVAGDVRLTGVDADAHPDPRVTERLLDLQRGKRSVNGLTKGHEERVARRVDLDAAVSGEDLAQPRPVIEQDVAVRVAQLLDEPRRARDVAEQEGHGALGKAPHDAHASGDVDACGVFV